MTRFIRIITIECSSGLALGAVRKIIAKRSPGNQKSHRRRASGADNQGIIDAATTFVICSEQWVTGRFGVGGIMMTGFSTKTFMTAAATLMAGAAVVLSTAALAHAPLHSFPKRRSSD